MMATAASYRLNSPSKIDESSSEEGELQSDDEEDLQRQGKRLKVSPSVTTTSLSSIPEASGLAAETRPIRRKPNNIWEAVLADQSSIDISNSFGVVGMKNYMQRGPESFSLELAMKEKKHHLDESSSDEEEGPSKPMRVETMDEEMENYMIQRHFCNQKMNYGAPSSGLKRKRTKKNTKAKNNVPQYKPGQRVTLNRKVDIGQDDSEDKVAEELTYRLWEKKKDLVRALVHAVGVEKSLLLYNKTEAVELCGGMMTLQGTRRRTPGGTFLHLLRNDSDINQDDVNKVFEADYLREREVRLMSKKAKKQAKEAPIDVGETPQNSPRMESLDMTSCDPSLELPVKPEEEEMDDMQLEQNGSNT
ncbi:unnamed protein product [Clavelina lepadiformis]|uniref:Phosphorylated adapter RNA export protein n=1 Tax=Clavelina lepadiformis TaxID=159417 RepID=A0ABP0GSR7_CLALP